MLTVQHVLFHSLKHHLHTITGFLRQAHTRSFPENLKLVKSFGASQFDLYTGDLSVETIAIETAVQLNAAGINIEQLYHEWTNAHGGHRAILLSDASEWTLRYLAQPAFVHIHPSRYALHTVRIKANAMKSVCCYMLLHGWQDLQPDAGLLNDIRTGHLGLSPLNARDKNEEILKVYDLLRKELIQ